MKYILMFFSCLIFTQYADAETPPWNQLSPEAARIIERAGTERPGTGAFLHHDHDGTYTCARCRAPLFASDTKFDSGCGWPSFDDALEGAVAELPDADGHRVEIRCARCDGHLGHVFRGERMTAKNTRHCVNSVAMDFTGGTVEQAFFAGGCFWGVEHLLESEEGVISVDSGYMGGQKNNPTYRQISTGTTGHAETVRVTFNPRIVSYETLTKLFLEIHDPTQKDRQGPDVGTQYRSEIFTTNNAQKATAHQLLALLKKRGYDVVTEVSEAALYWPAENYHQDYYKRTGKAPYCHSRVSRF